MYVISGRLKVEFPDETQEIGAGSAFLAPSNIKHRVTSLEDTQVISVKDLVEGVGTTSHTTRRTVSRGPERSDGLQPDLVAPAGSRRIDVHQHYFPRFLVDQGRGGIAVDGLRVEDGWVKRRQRYHNPLEPEFHDLEAMVASMDAVGVDHALMSVTPTLYFYKLRAGGGRGLLFTDERVDRGGPSPWLPGAAADALCTIHDVHFGPRLTSCP